MFIVDADVTPTPYVCTFPAAEITIGGGRSLVINVLVCSLHRLPLV